MQMLGLKLFLWEDPWSLQALLWQPEGPFDHVLLIGCLWLTLRVPCRLQGSHVYPFRAFFPGLEAEKHISTEHDQN